MHSTHNEGKFVMGRFIRTLKNKIYKYTTSLSKNVYIDKLVEIVNKYDNTYHRTTKMKLVDVNPSMYVDFNKENNMESPIFQVGDLIRISKYNFFLQMAVPIGTRRSGNVP